MRYAYIIPLLLLLLPVGNSRAQDTRPGFRTIGVNDGLSQNSVNSIFQDSRGYMWFGTGDGLNRYDGNSIKTYKVIDSPDAAGNSNTIRGELCEDKRGNIWFTTETGLYYFDREKQVIAHALVWKTSAELKKYGWYDLKIVNDSQEVYLVGYNAGILQYNITTQKLQHYDLPWSPARSLEYAFSAVDSNGDIWIRMDAPGVTVFDHKTKRYSRRLNGREVLNICFGRKRNYILGVNQLYLANKAMQVYDSIAVPPLANMHGRKAYEDGYERPWVLTYTNSVLVPDRAAKKMVPLADTRLAAFCNNPVAMCNDRNNNLWIGTDNNGLCCIDTKPRMFGVFPGDAGEQLTAAKFSLKDFCEDSAGYIWFATHGNGFLKYDRNSNAVQAYSIAGNLVGGVFYDSNKDLWAGGNNGLYVCRRGAWHKVAVGDAAPAEATDYYVSAFVQVAPGRLLIATARGLLQVETNGKTEAVKRLKTMLPRIGDIVMTKSGDVWMNIRPTGAHRMAIVNDSVTIAETVYPNSNTSCIHCDEQDSNLLWIGADKGLVSYNTRTKEQQVYNEAHGLGNTHVYAIEEDNAHRLWLSTNGGIWCFDKRMKTFRGYTVKDGLQSNEFNTDCSFKGADGTLYFGGINGFNWFNPAAPAQDTVAPLLDMAGVNIDDTLAGKEYWSGDSVIIMPYGRKNIRFSFAVLDYTLPEANTILYTLGDGNGGWYRANEKTILYTSLSPGEYMLQVKAVNSAGVESAVKKIRFTILPPFWQTAWFAMGAAVAAIVLIVLVTRSIAQRKLKARLAELEKIKEIDKERLRISREMHDDIGAGLTQITLMSEMAKNKTMHADSKELQDIALTSRRLVSNMNEIIWSLNAEGRTLEHLFAYLRENLNKLLEYSGIEYSISFPEQVPDITLSNEQRRNLLLIVKEAANNAVKYSKGSNIRISAALADGCLSFTIADDGVGFNILQQQAGNGLNNLKKRAADLAGQLEITSAAQKGTTVCVSIPLKSHFVTGK